MGTVIGIYVILCDDQRSGAKQDHDRKYDNVPLGILQAEQIKRQHNAKQHSIINGDERLDDTLWKTPFIQDISPAYRTADQIEQIDGQCAVIVL